MEDLITVKIKDDERKLTKSFPYPSVSFEMTHEDEYLKSCVNECLEEFKGSPTSIQIRTILNW